MPNQHTSHHDPIVALLAYVRFGNATEAADYLGMGRSTVFRHLAMLRRAYGAKHTTHLVVLMYPWLKNFYVIAHDEPKGQLRGRAA